MRFLFVIRAPRARIRVDWELLSPMLFTIGRRASTVVVSSSFNVDFVEFIRASAVVMIVKVSAAAGYVVVVLMSG